MLRWLSDKILGRELELRERMFRVIILIGGSMSIVGIVECMFIMDVGIIIAPLFFLLVLLGIALFMTFKYHKIDMAAVFMGIVIIMGLFPCMFFLSGGIEGGPTVWFVLGLFYVFMMFSGKRLASFLILSVIVDVGTYVMGYLHPEWIVPMRSRQAAFLDSCFAVLVVGFAVGIILKFQMKIYEIECTVTLQQKEEIEKISASKNEFFANMSHEIRTPINTIIGLNEMILRENTSGEVGEYAGNIKAASRMLLNLVNDILDLSRMEIKRIEIVPEEYRTAELFRELIDMIQVAAGEKKLELRVDIDETLPTVLYGDEKRIKQVVLNLLTNAVKYTEEGSVTFTVCAQETAEAEICLEIAVADTGIGIRKEDFDVLYDAFRRVDKKRTNHVEGSGLGLAITKQLLDLMGGEITVDSIYTKGTTFTVHLKQQVVDQTPIGKQDFTGRTHVEESSYKQSFEAPEARVLIVDDNELNAQIVQRLLAPTNMQMDIACGGEACLKKTKQKYYHVILMDYMMPKMNGIETLQAVRRQENGLCRESAVIILTANIMMDARELCAEYGFDGYLEKPVQPAELEAEILSFLPNDIVEYRRDLLDESAGEARIEQITRREKKKIYIASDSVCDLPDELLERYDIKLMYLYIETKDGRFTDTREIDADNLSMYMTQDSSEVHSCVVSVEEYEDFFAEMLTCAEHVIYVSMAAYAGKSYETALTAAKGFDHVHVIDSGLVSGGEGMVALYAAKLAGEGKSVHEICESLEQVKGQIASSILLPTSRIFYKNGYTNVVTAKLCDVFHLHPSFTVRHSRIVITGVRIGNVEHAWKRFLRWHLHHKRKINTDVIIITHVGCTLKQQEMIRQEVIRCVPFHRIYMQKASFSNSCNAGIGTIGIAFYTKQ